MRTAIACLLLAASGCGPSAAPFQLALSWRFADGRSCADAGAQVVVPSAGQTVLGPSGGLECADGELGQQVTVDDVPGDAAALTLRALSAAGATLYQGDLAISQPPPASATVTLYFVQ